MAHLVDEGDYPQAQGPKVWPGYCQPGMPAGHGNSPTAQECLFEEQQLQATSWVGEPFKGTKRI